MGYVDIPESKIEPFRHASGKTAKIWVDRVRIRKELTPTKFIPREDNVRSPNEECAECCAWSVHV